MDPAGVSLRSIIYMPMVAGAVAAICGTADYVYSAELPKDFRDIKDTADWKSNAMQSRISPEASQSLPDGVSVPTSIALGTDLRGGGDMVDFVSSLFGAEAKKALEMARADPSRVPTTVTVTIGSKMPEVRSQPVYSTAAEHLFDKVASTLHKQCMYCRCADHYTWNNVGS
jgi:hypothetical protein